jgi:hypothetical protein
MSSRPEASSRLARLRRTATELGRQKLEERLNLVSDLRAATGPEELSARRNVLDLHMIPGHVEDAWGVLDERLDLTGLKAAFEELKDF